MAKKGVVMLSKRTIVNLLLLALVASLTMYINRNPIEDNEVFELTKLNPGQVDTIVIQRADQTQVILEKSDQTWLITSPIEGKADPEKLNLLLKFLTLKSRHQHEIMKQKELHRYELFEPKVTLFLSDEQFDFGNTNDFNHLRYVFHDGIVHSVKDITHHLLIADAESFIAKSAE